MTHDSSAAHLRTRRDHSQETAEDYAEAVAGIADDRGACRVIDLARHFGVSHVTVTRTLDRLQAEGLVSREPYGPIALTAKGLRLARESKRRHELVYRFLLALGVTPKVAAIDTEGIEHHVSPETLRCFRRFLEKEGRDAPQA